MTLFFLQSGPHMSPPPGPGAPVVLLGLFLPALMLITGTVLGFRALRDIRLAEGRLGGAMLATLGGGLLPGIVIVIACGFGFNELMEGLAPPGRRHGDAWLTIGCFTGIWLTFLMMRGMYREATGWQKAAPTETASRSALTTVAIVCTIVGAALLLLLLMAPRGRTMSPFRSPADGWLMIDVALLLTGLVCGVLARRETAARVCAWICGAIFIFLVLVVAA